MAKVFLSFLGTNKYVNCNFLFNSQKIKNVKFVQEALIRLVAKDFKKEDKVIIFLTKDARTKNWEDSDINENRGLSERLNDLSLEMKILDIGIPDGNSEKQIWKIFEIIFKQISENDEIIFDITHGFRSLPMLCMVLLNYSRFLKNTRIKGIFYGAFEVLGPVNKVKEMHIKDRNAPIFDLTSFDNLQQWSVAADNFVNYGNSEKIKKLINKEINPILKVTKGQNEAAKNINELANYLHKFTLQIQTVRGDMLVKGVAVKNIKKIIKNIKENEIEYKAFSPIIHEIEKKIERFLTDDIKNGFRAVEWCLNHNLIQQGITMLQETIITYILDEIDLEPNKLNRELVSCAIYIKNRKINEDEWNEKCQKNLRTTKSILKYKEFNDLSKIYDELREHRNDINHGGYLSVLKGDAFQRKIESAYKKLKEIIKI